MARQQRRETPQAWQNVMRRAGYHYLSEVAKAADLSIPTVTRIVHRDTKAPEERTMFRLARVLNITPGELYKLAGHPAPAGDVYEPVTESAYLTPAEREALDELIKTMTKDRRVERPHRTEANLIPLHPADLDLAADDARGPSDGMLFHDAQEAAGEENQDGGDH